MNEVDISLKTKWSEVLDTLNLIIVCVGIYLAIFGIIISNSELIIQSCIIYIVYTIFVYINIDVLSISNTGIYSKRYGFMEWKEFGKVDKKKNIFYIYGKNNKKLYKFIVNKSGDNIEIERAYKYMLSKIDVIDDILE